MSSIFHHLSHLFGAPHPLGHASTLAARPKAGSDSLDPAGAPQKRRLAPGDLVSGLRFGVEVEHQGLKASEVAEAVHANIPDAVSGEDCVDSPDGRTWTLDYDGGGIELITPILQGQQDLQLLQKIVQSLAAAGGTADERAGLHVHIDAEKFSAEQVQALVALMARNEHWMYPLWGVHASRRDTWCKALHPVRASRCVDPKSRVQRSMPAWRRLRRLYAHDRDYGLNLQNYLYPTGKNTIEFRYLNGTLDAANIGCAVGFYMALAEHALQAGDTERARQTQRSTLPGLLAEIGVDRDHPIAEHLLELLRQRILEGWAQLNLGTPTDIEHLLTDDTFVEKLCCALDPGDGAVEVAAAAHTALTSTGDAWPALLEKAAAFAEKMRRALGTRPGMGFCIRYVHRCHVPPEALIVFLRRMDFTPPWSHHFNRTLQRIGESATSPEHLQRIAHAACIIAPIAQRNYEDRFSLVHRMLGWPQGHVTTLHEVLGWLPEEAAKWIGISLLNRLESGMDIRAIAERMLGDAELLAEDPYDALHKAVVATLLAQS